MKSKKEESRQVLGKTKRIKDATLIAKPPTDVEEFQKKWFEVQNPEIVDYDYGDKDAPPLEMTDELNEELIELEREKEEKQKEIRSKTEHFTNGINEWQLIAKTYNNILDWEHVTQAMKVGSGCLVCVKEAIGQRMHSTMTYVPNVRLVQDIDNRYSKGEKWMLL